MAKQSDESVSHPIAAVALSVGKLMWRISDAPRRYRGQQGRKERKMSLLC